MDNNTINEIKEIWKEIFSDNDQYVDTVINGLNDTQIFLIKDVGHIVSMAFMSPYNLKYYDKVLKCGYFFGAATLPEKRNKGYMEKIIDMTKDAAKKEGLSAIILIPETTSLFNYYKRFGFKLAFGYTLKEYVPTKSKKETSSFELVDIKDDAESYNFLALTEQKRDITFLHSKEQFDKVLKEYEEENYHSLSLIDKNNGAICAMLFAEPKDKDSLIVKDILSTDSHFKEIALDLFMKKTGRQSIIVKEEAGNGPTIPIAMVFDMEEQENLKLDNGFISLMME